jgi:addiction module HigA family antidote
MYNAKRYMLGVMDSDCQHREAHLAKKLKPVHPGEILREEFLAPLGLSMNKLALDLHVPVTRIGEIVHERRGITPETALRLAQYFRVSADFWMNLQTQYDLEVAQDRLQDSVKREVHPIAQSRRARAKLRSRTVSRRRTVVAAKR